MGLLRFRKFIVPKGQRLAFEPLNEVFGFRDALTLAPHAGAVQAHNEDRDPRIFDSDHLVDHLAEGMLHSLERHGDGVGRPFDPAAYPGLRAVEALAGDACECFLWR